MQVQAPLDAQPEAHALLAGVAPTISTPEEALMLAQLIEDHVPLALREDPYRNLNLSLWLRRIRDARFRGDHKELKIFEEQVLHMYPYALEAWQRYLVEGAGSGVAAEAAETPTVTASTAALAGGAGPGVVSGSRSAHAQASEFWVVRRRQAWLRPEERALPDVHSVLRQTAKVPLTIADGISAIALAELIATEFRFERPPALLVFSAKFLALMEQESARSEGRGNPAEYDRIDQEVIAAYPAALAGTRAEMDSVESRLAETTRRERERYAHEYLEAARAAGVEVGNVATSSSMSNQLALEPGTTVKVPTEAIIVPAGRQVGSVDWLVESMRELGQLQPIVVTRGGELIAGAHRLRAALLLGWTHISVVVLDLAGTKKKLAILDENLVRRQLPALEYAEALAERQQLYESLHPETQQHRRGGAAKAAKAASEIISVADSFAADTAARMGLTPRSVQLYTQVAGISSEVRDVLRSSSVNDKLTELVAVARLPGTEQKNVAAVLSQGGAKNVKEAVGLVRAPSTTSPLPYAVTQGPRIRKQVGDIRRVSADVEATLKEWQATDPTGMAPFITQWTNIAASMSGACAVANQVEIPAAACPCGGSRACSGCGGRGWKKDK